MRASRSRRSPSSSFSARPTKSIANVCGRSCTSPARLEGVDLGTGVNASSRASRRCRCRPEFRWNTAAYTPATTGVSELALVLVAGTILMFLVLVWEFARIAPALACLIAALACLAGSFIALDLTGMTLNISSFMGIIMVAGITAKNGILLLDHAEREVVSGTRPRAALLDAAHGPAAAHHDDNARDCGGPVAAGTRLRGRRQSSAAVGDSGDRRPRVRDVSINSAGRWNLSDGDA